MSDEEYESFEVTDYDLQTEFNPNRFRRKTTKNQHIYGVWAPEDDSDGDERPRRTKGVKGRPDYTSGVSFISAGVQQPNKDAEKPSDEAKEEGEGEDIPVTDSSRYTTANYSFRLVANGKFTIFNCVCSEDESVAIPKAFMKRQESSLGDTAGLRSREIGRAHV